jgi:hypothetical protein
MDACPTRKETNMVEANLKSATGPVVHISEADARETFVCIGCGEPVRPVRGRKKLKPWHFRHEHDEGCAYLKENPGVGYLHACKPEPEPQEPQPAQAAAPSSRLRQVWRWMRAAAA